MRIAQILNNKAHYIFEASEIPNWPPYPDGTIPILIDITKQPDVQEGWGYNADAKTFTPPPEEETQEFVPPITNQDLMEIQLLNMMITLEDMEIRKAENKTKNANLNTSHTIAKGWATLANKGKITIQDVPKHYKNLVLTQLNLKENNITTNK